MVLEFIFFVLIGLIFGSFLNALIYRLAKHLPLWQRSICPHCRQKLLNRDLIPLLSFILLRGRCRFCKKLISWQYFIVELATAILFGLAYLSYGSINVYLAGDLFFIFILLFILIFDLKYFVILDLIIWPGVILSLVINLWLGWAWYGLIFSGLVGAGFFYLQYLVTRGKGIGWGDVKLGLLLGVMLGLGNLIVTLLLAYVIGGFIALVMIVTKKKKFGDLLPLGTFLAGAAIVSLLFGEKIFVWLFRI